MAKKNKESILKTLKDKGILGAVPSIASAVAGGAKTVAQGTVVGLANLAEGSEGAERIANAFYPNQGDIGPIPGIPEDRTRPDGYGRGTARIPSEGDRPQYYGNTGQIPTAIPAPMVSEQATPNLTNAPAPQLTRPDGAVPGTGEQLPQLQQRAAILPSLLPSGERMPLGMENTLMPSQVALARQGLPTDGTGVPQLGQQRAAPGLGVGPERFLSGEIQQRNDESVERSKELVRLRKQTQAAEIGGLAPAQLQAEHAQQEATEAYGRQATQEANREAQEFAMSQAQFLQDYDLGELQKEKLVQDLGKMPKENAQKLNKTISSLQTLMDTSSRIIDTATKAGRQTNWLSAGFFHPLKYIGGTSAADLEANLNTVQADAAFDTLQTMRDNSPTGGALGPISERELVLLRDAKAALMQKQSPTQLKANLENYAKVRNLGLERVKEAFVRDYGTAALEALENMKPSTEASREVKGQIVTSAGGRYKTEF